MMARSPSTTARTSRTKKSTIATPEHQNRLSVKLGQPPLTSVIRVRTHSDGNERDRDASVPPGNGRVAARGRQFKGPGLGVEKALETVQTRRVAYRDDTVRDLA